MLFGTGVPVAMMRLLPWYAGPRAAELEQAVIAATDAITSRAQATYRPSDGPR